MKFRGILAIVFSLSLALFAGNALAAGGKNDKGARNDRHSTKHSEKSTKHSEKSAKGSNHGNGYGHCKSDKRGQGHSKKKGKGHGRDDNCVDDDNGDGNDDAGDPPVLVCFASVERFDFTSTIATEDGPLTVTESVQLVGQICDAEESTVSNYLDPVAIPSENRTCFVDSVSVGEYSSSETEFWYPIDILLLCENTLPN